MKNVDKLAFGATAGALLLLGYLVFKHISEQRKAKGAQPQAAEGG